MYVCLGSDADLYKGNYVIGKVSDVFKNLSANPLGALVKGSGMFKLSDCKVYYVDVINDEAFMLRDEMGLFDLIINSIGFAFENWKNVDGCLDLYKRCEINENECVYTKSNYANIVSRFFESHICVYSNRVDCSVQCSDSALCAITNESNLSCSSVRTFILCNGNDNRLSDDSRGLGCNIICYGDCNEVRCEGVGSKVHVSGKNNKINVISLLSDVSIKGIGNIIFLESHKCYFKADKGNTIVYYVTEEIEGLYYRKAVSKFVDGVNIKENTIYCFNDGVIEGIEESR